MGKIVELNQHVSNQIAAGEVVERPSSVVKELIENALDAGAQDIEVRIKGGGLVHIVVQDDGCGMDEADVKLAIKRYATSKLKNISDLDEMATFGFRGEALPSIASVSRMAIISRADGQKHATKALIEGGQVVDAGRAGGIKGTRIEVKDLFYNVPARLKFIKSKRAESAQIERLLKAYAFNFSAVSWRFFCDDKKVFAFSLSENYVDMDRAAALLGKDVKGYLYHFSDSRESIGITGVIAAPMVVRRDTRSILLYVNDRLISDKKLIAAIKVAFRTLLEVGRSPVCALKIAILPTEVDVNVHPRKSEVRFTNERQVFSQLIGMVGEFLAQTPWLRSDYNNAPPRPYHSEQPSIDLDRSFGFVLKPGDRDYQPPSLPATPTDYGDSEEQLFSAQDHRQPRLLSSKSFLDLRPIGQVCATYLLLESEDGLVVIDQHAAHERVVFERIRHHKKNCTAKSELLIPIHLAVDFSQMATLQDHLDELKKIGIEIEKFGESSAVVRAIPDYLSHCDVASLIKDILADLDDLGRATTAEKLFDHLCATLACHSSIRAGQRLSHEEICALLKELDGIEFSAHCPHGRPIVKSFGRSELKKWFDRT